jgi:hypothetical protein
MNPYKKHTFYYIRFLKRIDASDFRPGSIFRVLRLESSSRGYPGSRAGHLPPLQQHETENANLLRPRNRTSETSKVV